MQRIVRLLTILCLFSAFAAHAQTLAPRRTGLTIEGDHFLLDGKPFKILSGEMHYERIPRAYWRQRMQMARAMGLNTISTYVFWNFHEPEPGTYDFSGNADLAAFVRMAQEEHLYVLLRPGPYSCAEWELGGLPAWLMATPESARALRSNDPLFMQPVERWIKRLGKEVASLQYERGGPILMTQIENEYGGFGSDKVYMAHLHDIFVSAGFTDSLLYTVDGWRDLAKGDLPGIFAAVNFGVTAHARGMDALEKERPGQPLFVSEYWPGWFDHWGHAHETRPTASEVKDIDYILTRGAGINIYMLHGGTSFGFWSGANWHEGKLYQPDVTSYDYDAPIDEAGHATPKYYAFRDALKKYATGPLPAEPAAPPVVTVAPFMLTDSSPLWKNLPPAIAKDNPVPMEAIGQNLGYILYRTRLTKEANGELALNELHDFAHIYIDGKFAGALDRRDGHMKMHIEAPAGAQLDILVANDGRANSTVAMCLENKGITQSVTLDGAPLTGWSLYPLPMPEHSFAHVHFSHDMVQGPGLYRGTFTLAKTGDVFLDVHTLHKGALWINGHAIGRYWNVGPQQTLYVPGPWLHKGANEIIVFDMSGFDSAPTLAGLAEPILNAPVEGGVSSKQKSP